MSREEAYTEVQKNAMRSWNEHTDFKKLILEDKGVMSYLKKKDVDDVFRVENFLKNVDFIFKRVFG